MLDEQFVRCSPASFFRYRFGIHGRKHHTKANSFIRGSAGGKPIVFKAWDASFGQTVLMEMKGGTEGRQLTQMILTDALGDDHHILLTEGMCAKDVLERMRELSLSFPIDARFVFDPDKEPWVPEMANILWPDKELPPPNPGAKYFKGGTLEFRFTSRFLRELAKIGFHYALTQLSDFSGHEDCFDGVREFITDDKEGDQWNTVNRFVRTTLPPSLSACTEVFGHVLGVEVRSRVLLAHVEPFITRSGRMSAFTVLLARFDEPQKRRATAHLYQYDDFNREGPYTGQTYRIADPFSSPIAISGDFPQTVR